MSDIETAHHFAFEKIDGGRLVLGDLVGKAILVVNTASECGYTPQYAGLEALWRDYRDRGLVVLGVPSNDFGGQEPGDESDIRAFCDASYGVTFPLTRKQTVIGGDAHPLYRWIAELLGEDQAPRWNFHKYLVAPDGTLAGAWPSAVEPLSPDVVGTVEQTLAHVGRDGERDA